MTNEYLRHTIATIKYRFEKSVKNSKAGFGDITLGSGSRSPKEIINHMYDVLRSTRSFLQDGTSLSGRPDQLGFQKEIKRFLNELTYADKALAEDELQIAAAKKLLQGPFSDILTHIGQISMLQRFNNNPIPSEDFSRASIKTGLSQTDPANQKPT